MFVDNREVVVTGEFLKIAKLKSEFFEYVGDPSSFVARMKDEKLRADLFTFLQETPDRNPRFDFHLEWESISVLPITTYENWWKKQIKDKTRNVIRKAQKNGVELRVVEFNDDLVRGIQDIYNESPLRQGKPFMHYGKEFETLKRAHISYLEKSDFIGAFYGGELIGFIKLVHGKGISNIMQILSKMAHRNKSPTNALVAKAVEICAQRGVPYLHYGVWSRGGLGDFKKNHAFERFEVPRYFVPLTSRGKLSLMLKLHHRLRDHLPERWLDYLVGLRTKWYSYKLGMR